MPTTITCPDCGTPSEFDGLVRDATEFCGHCDYPLFWARPDGPHLVAVEGADSVRRRLPGAEGKVIIGSRLCPECGEQNLPEAKYCTRLGCHALMDPPEPEPVVVVEAPPPPPPPPAPEPRNWWPWILGGVTAALLVVLLIVWLW